MLEKVKFTDKYEYAKFAINLFLADKKKKENMWLVCASHDTKIDMKLLTKKFGCGSGNLRGGGAEVMEATLGVKAGAVNLFSVINDKENKINLVID